MATLRFFWGLVLICSMCLSQAQVSQECSQSNTLVGFQQFCLNLKCPESLPRTCKDVVSDEPRKVAILWDGTEVLCDTKTDGGGWLIIQRRVNGEVDFYRNWDEYKYGFGDINADFWFGNEKVHRLTTHRRYELRVDFNYSGTAYFAAYSHFRLFGEPEKYKIDVSGFSGDAGDSLAIHNNMAFSTKNQDNDIYSTSCAQRFHGAWWYINCLDSNLNGAWASAAYGEGLNWETITGNYASATFTEMKIRPLE